MEKSNYKLFFYLGDKPVNINLKHVLNPQATQSNETRAKLFNQDIQKNIYTKAKQNYEFLIKKNKNIYMLNKKGGKFSSKEYLEALENFDKKIKKDNFSLLPFPQHKKENNKSVEELRRMQRNKVTMRRIEYSMKVKHTANKKRCKYNIKKVITIQKWVRGFLLRNLLSNLSYFEDFTNEFMEHIKKFVFLKHKKIMSDIIKYLQYKGNKNSINEIKNYNSLKNPSNNNSIKKEKEKNLDIIKENSNERYIDEDSIIEYNNRYNRNSNDFNNNNNKNIKENKNINNNILFFSSKDFSDKIILNQRNNDSNINALSNSSFNSGNNNPNNNNNIFQLNESSISPEKNKEINKNNINNNKLKEDTLNSNKEENHIIKNEEPFNLFKSKNSNDLKEQNPNSIKNILINNIKTEANSDINLNNQLLIRRPKLNRKFIEEINNTHSSATPTKYNNFLNNNEFKNNKNSNKKNKEKESNQKEEKNKNGKNSNSIKLNNNQVCSISNPTNSTLDSNTLNINRKIFLDENFNINSTNNKKPQIEKSEKEKEKIKSIIKPIIYTCYITKIIIDKRKIQIEKIYSKSEKKFIPKVYDMNNQSTEENINIELSKEKKEQNCDDTLKNILNTQQNQNDSSNIINYEINKDESSDMNINVLKVVNNNIDELNNSIKNIVKEELPSPAPDIGQNKQNLFTKSLRELLKLDQQQINGNLNNNNNSSNNIINNSEEENSFNNSDNNINININNDNTQNKDLDISNNKMSIEAIKEVKEEYEEEKENDNELTQKKIGIFNISNNSEIIDLDNINNINNKKNDLIKFDKNTFFSIVPKKKFDKKIIIIVYMFERQIKYNIKPFIFNMLKRFWIDKLKKM